MRKPKVVIEACYGIKEKKISDEEIKKAVGKMMEAVIKKSELPKEELTKKCE
jgi:hypothetical protein